jgi:hypothetical protein
MYIPEIACLASSPGRMSRTDVWLTRGDGSASLAGGNMLGDITAREYMKHKVLPSID